MAHIIRYNGYTTSATSRKRLNYTWAAEPSMVPDRYERWDTTVEVMFDAATESALASAMNVTISAWSGFNKSFTYSVGGTEIFSFSPGTTAGIMRTNLDGIEQKGTYGKLRVRFNYSLGQEGGRLGTRRGSYTESWAYDNQLRQTVRYQRRERWDDNTYSTPRLQADNYLDNDFEFPDGKSLANEDESDWRLGRYDVSLQQDTYPSGSAIDRMWKFVDFSWDATEKKMPFPVDGPSTAQGGVLEEITATVAQSFGSGTAFAARLDRTVRGSFKVNKKARNTLQTWAAADYVWGGWRRAVQDMVVERYLPEANWYHVEPDSFDWSVDGRSCSFSIRGQSRTLKTGEGDYTRNLGISPRRAIPAFQTATKFIEAEVSENIVKVREIRRHEKLDGNPVLEETRRPFYRVRLHGRFQALNPADKDLTVVEPSDSDYESTSVRCVGFDYNVHLGEFMTDNLRTNHVTWNAEFEVYDETAKIDWSPMEIPRADLIPQRKVIP